MITDKPYRHTGDIYYPGNGEMTPDGPVWDNYPPRVLARGLESIPSIYRQFGGHLTTPTLYVFHTMTGDGLVERTGVHYLDTRPVYHAAVMLAYDIVEQCIVERIARTRIGLLGYTAVAEQQSFTKANKRAGRVLYGWLRYGVEAADIRRGIDAVLDDVVPPEIEQLVLLQNISRCRNNAEPSMTQFGGVYVEPTVLTDLERQRELLDSYRYVDKASSSRKDFHDNLDQLVEHLENVLDNKELIFGVASTLIQEDYGPAAWLLCCPDKKLEAMTPEIAQKLIATNTRLLQMRVIALLNAVANGGKFVQITDSDDGDRERRVDVISWTPTEQPSGDTIKQ